MHKRVGAILEANELARSGTNARTDNLYRCPVPVGLF